MNKIIILLLFLCSVVFSQNNAIVTDYKKNPLPDVDIYFADLDLLLTSDKNGLFIIPKNISKKNIIEFYKLGYESLVVKLEDNNNLGGKHDSTYDKSTGYCNSYGRNCRKTW